MRGLFVLGNGFEDTETIAVIDILKRANLKLHLATPSDTLEVITQSELTIKVDMFLNEINVEDYNFIVIPGGKAVYQVLDKSKLLSEIIIDFADKEKLIAAICAGPTQVGKLGLYEGKSFTCFPTTEKQIPSGNYIVNKGVVVSDNYISAKAMGYSIEFGLAIVEYLLGADKALQVKKAVYGEISN